uniref:Uncharacterized protein n=1 Tax=Strongyloides papillosus TaxID=174720 RepID=A0A0N5CFB9_STREA
MTSKSKVYCYKSSFDPPKQRNLQSEIIQKNIRNGLNGDRSLMRSKSFNKLKNIDIEWHFQMKHYIEHRMKVLNAKPTINSKPKTRSTSVSGNSSKTSSKISTRPSTGSRSENKQNYSINSDKEKKERINIAQKHMREAMLKSLSRMNLNDQNK